MEQPARHWILMELKLNNDNNEVKRRKKRTERRVMKAWRLINDESWLMYLQEKIGVEKNSVKF